jgi:hypothetical protein
MKKILMIIIIIATYAGCSRNIRITYTSTPSGAALYQAGQMVGTTPATLTYLVTDADKEQGTKKILGTNVVWASGARASVKDFALPARPGKYVHNFGRPEHTGLQTDLAVAERQNAEREMRRQATMTRDARALGQILESTKGSGNYYYIAQ